MIAMADASLRVYVVAWGIMAVKGDAT